MLKTGLRIMPHSGGRVGKGIYLARSLLTLPVTDFRIVP